MADTNKLDIGACEAKDGVRAVAPEAGEEGVYRVTCEDGHPLPTVVLGAGKKKWNLSPYVCLAVDVRNLGREEFLVELRPNEIGAITVGGGQAVPAGETRTVRAYLIRDEYPKCLDERFKGMFAFPGHPSVVRVWSGLHPGAVDRFSLVLVHPPKGAVFTVGNVRGEGSFAFLTEAELEKDFFPFVDEFGQYRHREWPGKTHSEKDLAAAKAQEERDLAAHPAPKDWNKYGGWVGGPQREATGHFRTEKVDGKWWLVDPEGRLFWAHGTGLTLDGQPTPIEGREHYFSALPEAAKFKEFYGTRGESRMFNHYTRNLLRKQGAEWKKESARLAERRLASWGMNAYYSWSVPTVLGTRGVPYAIVLSTGGAQRIEGSKGYWSKFPDPFDPGFAGALEARLEEIGKTASDPYCIGYFVDNEMDWKDESYLAGAVLESPKEQPAKRALVERLKAKYGTVGKLNAAWGTALGSWDAVLANTTVPAGAREDLVELTAMIGEQYFRTVKETLRRLAPQKLYLGCRFHDHYYPDESSECGWVVKIAARYCDVVSFNRYRYSAADLRPADADVPIIISEWHMGALDRGLLHYTLRFAASQEHRAELYEHYVKSCLANPYIVGSMWFKYDDEPVAGRFDGENFNTGFVDVCDRTYPEMVRAAREMGKALYGMRF